ncbi:hypothetical protein C4L39_25745 [Clostridium diolis]|uniref:hypothetical protein n=1 Tax=Clostridium diolis TaxID=223919 RepID=UPI000D11B14B|nr:hypothetical protein [Clostridium diolis]PSM54916.1 hypothetical protein C4L39_25745 [Clostridium diolis]
MAELSLVQAATLAGKSKSTLTRAIKSGRMSAVRRDDGTFGLDPAEVLRVFPRDTMRNVAFSADAVASDAMMHPAQQAEISALRDDLAAARQQAAVAQALADERARALEAAERNLADLRRLLPPPAAPASLRPWWRFWS